MNNIDINLILSSFITVITSLLTLFFTNRHNWLSNGQNLRYSKQQLLQEQKFGMLKIKEERIYNDRVQIIAYVQKIICENNLTQNYIFECTESIDNHYINQRYKEIEEYTSQIITRLYNSFPELVNDGKKILGKCNEIWGIEQNFFGYQKDNNAYKNESKIKLITLYNELSNICNELQNSISLKDTIQMLQV